MKHIPCFVMHTQFSWLGAFGLDTARYILIYAIRSQCTVSQNSADIWPPINNSL